MLPAARGRVWGALTLSFSLALTALPAFAAEITWTGSAGNGLWSTPTNWDLSRVPAAGDAVVIPAGSSVSHPSGTTVVDGVAAAGDLAITGGSLEVGAASSFSGTLEVRTATLRADGPAAILTASGTATIDHASLVAKNGGQISLPATSFITDWNATWLADGVDSRIHLPDLASATMGVGSGLSTATRHMEWTLEARAGGLISMPQLTSILVNNNGASARRSIEVLATGVDSEVDLSGLTSWRDWDPSKWSSLQATSGGTVTLSELVEFTGVGLTLDGTGTLDTSKISKLGDGSSVLLTAGSPDFSGVTTLGGVTLDVSSGAQITLPEATSLVTNRSADWIVYGTLSLPKLATITMGVGSGLSIATRNMEWTIEAQAGGLISMPQLTSILVNNNGASARRSIEVLATGVDSEVDLSGLTSWRDWDPSKWSSLQATSGGTVTLSELVEFTGVGLTLDGTGTLDTSKISKLGDGSSVLLTAGSQDFSGVTTLGGVTLDVSSGAQITLPEATSLVTNRSAQWTVEGTLSLPKLATITMGVGSGLSIATRNMEWTLEAQAGGLISMPQLTDVVVNNNGASARRTIEVLATGADSEVDLSSLTNWQDWDGSKWSRLEAKDSGTITLQSQTALTGVTLPIDGTGTFDTARIDWLGPGSGIVLLAGSPDFSNVTYLEGVSLEARNGATILLDGISSYVTNQGSTYWLADGAGSTISLPNLTSAKLGTAGLTFDQIWTVTARAGARISLPQLATIQVFNNTTGADRSIEIAATGAGSLIDLPMLSSWTDYDTSRQSRLEASGGATVSVGALTTLNRVDVVLDAASTIPTAQLTSLGFRSTLDLTGGSRDFSGLTELNGASVTLRSGASASFDNVSNADGTILRALGGTVISLPGVTEYVTDRTWSNNSTITEWRAEGSGSRIELPGLTAVELGSPNTSNAIRWDVLARDGGVIDAEYLESILVRGSNNNAVRKFNLESSDAGSELDMRSLGSFQSFDTNAPSTTLVGVGGSMVLGALPLILNVAPIDAAIIYAPRIVETDPGAGDVRNTPPPVISVEYRQDGGGLDTDPTVSIVDLTREGNPVSGTVAFTDTEIEFDPDQTFAEGDYELLLELEDLAATQSASVLVPFTINSHAPGSPGPVPISVDGAGNGTSVAIDWSSYDEGAQPNTIDHYRVYESTSAFAHTDDATEIAMVPAGSQTHSAVGVPRNAVRHYAVVAEDVGGNSIQDVTSTAATLSDVEPPNAPKNLVVAADSSTAQLSWSAPPDPDDDLAGYDLFVDEQLEAAGLAVESHQLTGLSPATGYAVEVIAYDDDGNRSNPLTGTAATYLPNPTGVALDPYHGRVEVSWTAAQPSNLVHRYRIYVDTSPITDISGMSPARTVSKSATQASVGGLQNGVTVYIAVTTVNLSWAEDPAVISQAATPMVDTGGPSLTDVRADASPILDGHSFAENVVLSASASDPSGVNRVEFSLSDGTSEIPIGTATSGTGSFARSLNLNDISDGSYTLIVRAYDSWDNLTETQFAVDVQLAPPAPPAIANPSDGYRTNQQLLSVSGTSVSGTYVRLYLGGIEAGGPFPVNVAGSWAGSVSLSTGANQLQAAGENRSGLGVLGAGVGVTLDQSVPEAPIGLSATARSGGEVELTWSAPPDAQVVGYDVYRSIQSFANVDQAVRVNNSTLSAPGFTDLPPSEAIYYYRVAAVNDVGTSSNPSNEAFAESDSTPPSATLMAYASSGATDPATNRFAPGTIDVTVTVSEPLLTRPFLSMAPTNGLPISIQLIRADDTTYTGQFPLDATTPTGTGYAVFSARDRVGNRGTAVENGASIEIDTTGPRVVTLVVSPSSPIQVDPAEPPDVVVDFVLDEEPVGGPPTVSFLLSGPGRQAVSIVDVSNGSGDGITWQARFTLPADAGENDPENMSVEVVTADDLGNPGVSTTSGADLVQVYQGDLPPLATPTGLTATARPAGVIDLAWNPVDDAARYQLYYRGPDPGPADPFVALGAPVTGTEHSDATTGDGLYEYTVTSIREVNNQQAESAQSAPVEAVADSQAPPAPGNLGLELRPRGILATWVAPSGGPHGPLSYRLFRANLAPGIDLAPGGLEPVIDRILGFQALDSNPSESDHAYAATAVDAAGNESAASNTAYLNFELLPVATLSLVQNRSNPPLVSWTHNGSSIADYELTVSDAGGPVAVVQDPQPSYVDTGWGGAERSYAVVPIDDQGERGLGRSATLPALGLSVDEEVEVARGIFNRVEVNVSNAGPADLEGASLEFEVDARSHSSAPFDVAAGETASIPIVVGGYDGLSATEGATLSLRQNPAPGESVQIVRDDSVNVGDSALFIQLDTSDLARGATGRVRFTIENTSEVETEIVTARNGGSDASDEVRLVVFDRDVNALSVTPVQIFVNSPVITIGNGSTVARIAPGASYQSPWIDVEIPESAPDEVDVVLEIDRFHYRLGSQEHLAILGHGTRRAASVIEPPYRGELTSIAPSIAFADESVVIAGQAIDNQSGEPLGDAPLDLVLRIMGFERLIGLHTEADGSFHHTFSAGEGEGGVYSVSVNYPGALERPEQGTFTIDSVGIAPRRRDLNLPLNYSGEVKFTVSAGVASAASGVRLAYDANDYPLGFPQGITVTPGDPVDLGPGEKAQLSVEISADNSLPEEERDETRILVLRLVAENESYPTPITRVFVHYTFSSAKPILGATPPNLETGVVWGDSLRETITIDNRGYVAMTGVEVSLVDPASGDVVPYWITLPNSDETSSGDPERILIGDLAVGRAIAIELVAAPTDAVTEGFYDVALRVTADNHAETDIPVTIAVTEDGFGQLLVRAADIYTATDPDPTNDDEDEFIPGLGGARIKLFKEFPDGSLDTSTVYEQTTGQGGETLFPELPAGRYVIRASAPDHNDVGDRVRILPGVVASKEVFLLNTVVTIEWSVEETTIEDHYRIVLRATYETDVPVPVLVAEPPSTTLPNLRAGDVFYGEFTITNYGLIEAFDFRVGLPATGGDARFEYLTEIPDRIAARQIIRIPYRVTALRDFDPALEGSSSGGGSDCRSWAALAQGRAICANRTEVSVGARKHFDTPSRGRSCTPQVTGERGSGGTLVPAAASAGGDFMCPLDFLCGPDPNGSGS